MWVTGGTGSGGGHSSGSCHRRDTGPARVLRPRSRPVLTRRSLSVPRLRQSPTMRRTRCRSRSSGRARCDLSVSMSLLTRLPWRSRNRAVMMAVMKRMKSQAAGKMGYSTTEVGDLIAAPSKNLSPDHLCDATGTLRCTVLYCNSDQRQRASGDSRPGENTRAARSAALADGLRRRGRCPHAGL